MKVILILSVVLVVVGCVRNQIPKLIAGGLQPSTQTSATTKGSIDNPASWTGTLQCRDRFGRQYVENLRIVSDPTWKRDYQRLDSFVSSLSSNNFSTSGVVEARRLQFRFRPSQSLGGLPSGHVLLTGKIDPTGLIRLDRSAQYSECGPGVLRPADTREMASLLSDVFGASAGEVSDIPNVVSAEYCRNPQPRAYRYRGGASPSEAPATAGGFFLYYDYCSEPDYAQRPINGRYPPKIIVSQTRPDASGDTITGIDGRAYSRLGIEAVRFKNRCIVSTVLTVTGQRHPCLPYGYRYNRRVHACLSLPYPTNTISGRVSATVLGGCVAPYTVVQDAAFERI